MASVSLWSRNLDVWTWDLWPYLDVGVAVLAVARDGRLVRRVGLLGAGAGDDELGALGVELGSVGLVQGDELVADEVVARSERSGDPAGPRLVAADQLGNVPARGGLAVEEDLGAVPKEARLVNLEPPAARPVARAKGPRALVHPHEDRALAVRPLLPDRRHVGTRRHRGRLCRRRAAVAAHLGVGARRDGVVVAPLTLNHVLGVAGGEALVSAGPGGLVKSSDPVVGSWSGATYPG